MISIYLQGSKATLVGEISRDVNQHLANMFSWTSPLVPDNTYHFYVDKVMYSGIVPFVKECLVELGHSVSIKWKTSPKDFEAKFTGEYREFQEEAVNSMLDKRFGIIKAPPGLGKTLIAASIIANIGKNGGVIVPNLVTLSQMKKAFKDFTDIPVSMIGSAGNSKQDVKGIMVATAQTVYNELSNNPEGKLAYWVRNSKVMLFDEAHHGASYTYAYILENLVNAEYIGGLTATPFRADDKSTFLTALFGPVISDVSYGEAVDSGILCPITVFVKTVPEKNYGYSQDREISRKHMMNRYQKVYSEYIIYNEVRNKLGINFVKAVNAKGHTCAVIVSRIEHAEELHRMCPDIKVLTAKMSSQDRHDLLDDLKMHRIMAVVTTLMDEATDVPSLGAVALMAGGKSQVKLLQRIRSTRTFSGELSDGRKYSKERGYVLYLRDRADFLRSHSIDNIKALKTLVAESEQNEYHDDEKSGRLEKQHRRKDHRG